MPLPANSEPCTTPQNRTPRKPASASANTLLLGTPVISSQKKDTSFTMTRAIERFDCHMAMVLGAPPGTKRLAPTAATKKMLKDSAGSHFASSARTVPSTMMLTKT